MIMNIPREQDGPHGDTRMETLDENEIVLIEPLEDEELAEPE